MGSPNMKDCIFNVCPQKIVFYAPYNRTQNRLLTILNPTATVLLFKIRCNCPWKYSVSPNCGRIEPYDTAEVRISLSYFKFQNGHAYKHRFCVQCTQASQDGASDNSQSILNLFKETPPSKINNFRISVDIKPEVCSIPNSELQILMPTNFLSSLTNNRPLGFNFMQHLKQLNLQLALPTLQKKRGSLGRNIISFFVILSGILGGNISDYDRHYRIHQTRAER